MGFALTITDKATNAGLRRRQSALHRRALQSSLIRDRLQIALDRSCHDGLAVRQYAVAPEGAMDRVKIIGCHRRGDTLHLVGIERPDIRIAVHEAHMFAVLDDLQCIADHQAAGLSMPRPMADRTTFEMPAAADQRHIRQDGFRLAFPEHDRRIWPYDPLPVVRMDIDRNAAENPTPFHDRRMKMWMRDGDRLETTLCLQRRNSLVCDERDAIPKHIAARRLDQQCALSDGETGLDADGQNTIFVLHHHLMVSAELCHGRPGLTSPSDILPLVFADGTSRGFLVARRELHAALPAHEMRHEDLRSDFSPRIAMNYEMKNPSCGFRSFRRRRLSCITA